MKIKEGIFDFQPGSYLVTTVYDIIGEITFPTYIRTEEEYRFAYMSSSGLRCRNFLITPNFIRNTKLRLTTATAIDYIRCYLLVRFI